MAMVTAPPSSSLLQPASESPGLGGFSCEVSPAMRRSMGRAVTKMWNVADCASGKFGLLSGGREGSTAHYFSSCRVSAWPSTESQAGYKSSFGGLSGLSRVSSWAAASEIGWASFSDARKMSEAGLGQVQALPLLSLLDQEPQEFLELGNKLADVAGKVILQYFRKSFDIIDKDDQSPVTVADRAAEEAMRILISQRFPSHAIFGEEGGLQMPNGGADYLWVLDPIDGTKSFITGKPVFGTLIALLHKGVPILGIIDQPVLRERWVGRKGERTTLNGEQIAARFCPSLSKAYLYTTSPHLFSPQTNEGFVRVRDKVKIPLYGCDCYAYGLLAAGHVDLVIESGLKPYDYLALVPVVEGAGGCMSDWNGQSLTWWPDENQPNSGTRGVEVIASGCRDIHEAALEALSGN